MKVLHVVRQFYPMVGGLENYVFHLTREQAMGGNRVTVLTLNKDYRTGKKLASREITDHGISIIRVPFWGSKKYPLAFSLIHHVREYDLIHVHGMDFFADFLAITRFYHRKPLFLTTHGGYFHTRWGARFKRLYFRTITPFTLKAYSKVIACSKNDHRIFSQISHNITTIENGADVGTFLETPKCRKAGELVYVGRIDLHKRVDRLIEITGMLIKQGYNVNLSIVGPDWHKLVPGLKALARQKNIEHRIRFYGLVDHDFLRKTLSRADIFISASEYEGFGISAIEALASGTLCVLNDIESFRSMLSGNHFGLIADFNNLQKTVSQIKGLLNISDKEYYYLSRKARRHASQYNWHSVAGKINSHYQGIQSSRSTIKN
jgi:alpha-1,3-mannosyltransferase